MYVFCSWYVTFVAKEMQAPNIGARIREARESLGLTQLEFANALELGERGHGQRTLQAWERNERTPRLPALMEIARVAERPISWFYEAPEDVAA